MRKKSIWILGGTIVAVLAVGAVAAVTLSRSQPRITPVAATSPAAARPSAPGPGKLVPIASASAAAHKKKAVSTHSASSAAVAAPAESLAPQSASAPAQAPKKAEAPKKAAPAVVSVPEPVSWWALNDDSGTTASDAMGVHPATGANFTWCSAAAYGNCANFNGTSTDFTTSGSVLDTAPGSSFTVSAMVYMNVSASFETIVSQDGTDDSGFYLQYVGGSHQWAFSRVTGDTDAGPGGIRALSTSAVPAINTWTHLVGVFDASDNQLRLYVNGVPQGTATDSSPFAATGDLVIGRGQFDGQPTDWFTGSLDQVKVYNQALSRAQVAKI